MSQPIRLTHRGQPYLVNPEQIVFVEASGSGASNVYFTNREYRQFEELVDQVETLWSRVTTQTTDIISDVPAEPPADVPPAEHPAKNRQTKPATPPETK